MLINNFSGGINNKLHKSVILDTQGVEVENVDLMSGVLQSMSHVKLIKEEVDNDKPFYFKGFWSYSSQKTSYARLLSTAFRAYDDILEKTSDGKTWENLWIQPPQVAPEVSEGEQYPDGDETNFGFYGQDIYYCYTYYNNTDGSESAPSPISAKIQIGKEVPNPTAHWIKGRGVIQVIKSTDPQVTHINIYRLGGGITNFQLAKQIENISANVTDSTSNSLLGDSLTTTGYIAPPKVSYICAYYALLFGVSESNSNVLYYSDEANPMTWNPLNYIVFDEPIVGLGASQLGLLVFTEYRVYIIYGTSAAEFQRYLLFDNIGCLSHNSIQSYKGAVLWQGIDGFYIFNGSECTNITATTLQPIKNIVISSCISNEVYYGVLDNGNIISIDLRLQGFPAVLITEQKATGVFAALNNVYIVQDRKLYTLTGGDSLRALKWVSKEYTDGVITNLKNYKYVYVYCSGEFTFKIYIDGTLAATIDLHSGFNSVFPNYSQRLGYGIQFEVEGKGSILAIEYLAEVRQQAKGV